MSNTNLFGQCHLIGYYCEDNNLILEWESLPNIGTQYVAIFVRANSSLNTDLYREGYVEYDSEDGVFRATYPFALCSSLPNDFLISYQGNHFCIIKDGAHCLTCTVEEYIQDATIIDNWLEGCSVEFEIFAAEVISKQFGCQQWDGECEKIARFGKVSIGRSNSNEETFEQSLAVTGGIISTRLKVDSDSWCDYVFEKDYNLMPLDSVKMFIASNKHLPNVPAGQIIEESGGFELKAITLTQQEKIEEIYLYLIQLQQEADLLSQEIEAAVARNKALKKS